MRTSKEVKKSAFTWHAKAISYLICLFLALAVTGCHRGSSNVSVNEWYVSAAAVLLTKIRVHMIVRSGRSEKRCRLPNRAIW